MKHRTLTEEIKSMKERERSTIPATAWNAMKGKMEDTSLPEWQEYYRKLKEHEDYMATKKPAMPDPQHLKGFDNYHKAMDHYHTKYSEWLLECSVNRPNPPGYEYANNH